MESNINLIGLSGEFKNKNKNKIIAYLKNSVVNIYKNNIKRMYQINTLKTQKENYIPLDKMVRSVRVTYDEANDVLRVFLDDDMDIKDKFGNDIYPKDISETINANGKIDNFYDHWQMPIDGKNELMWVKEQSKTEIINFIKNDFVKFLHINNK